MVVPAMSVYLEAMLLLLPPDAGGRTAPIAPREGSYRPFARVEDRVSRIRLLEGPPLVAPGEEARVVLELEEDAPLPVGAEMQVVEHGGHVVGLMTVMRVCRTTPV
jgi:translation elongation factor EF-Tu-like GTPase